MKKLMLIIFFLPFIVHYAYPTVGIDDYFELKNIELTLWQEVGHYDINFTFQWHANAILLDRYIENLKKKGVLKNKKVYIEKSHPGHPLGRPFLKFYKTEMGYFINEGYINFKEIVSIINYFEDKAFKPFNYTQEDWWKAHDRGNPHELNALLNQRLGNYSKVDLSFFKNKSITIWSHKELKIIVRNHEQFYLLNNRRLKHIPQKPFPIKFRDRFIIMEKDTLHLYNSKHLLMIYKLKNYPTFPGAKFVGYSSEDLHFISKNNKKIYLCVCHGDEFEKENVILTYIYSSNDFFEGFK